MKNLIVITGASTGIGHALALHFSNQKATVLAGVRSPQDFEHLSGLSPFLFPIYLDVAQPAHLQKLPQEIQERLDPDTRLVLINNAGVAISKPWELLTAEELQKQIAVNVTGPILVTQKCLPFLRQTKGLVINMSSVSGLFASPFLGPYSLSKFALEAFTDSLRREMAFFGVKVCSVNPGPIKTPIWEKGLKNPEIQKLFSHPVYGKIIKKFEKGVQSAVDRALDVDEVVKVVDEMIHSANPKIRVVVANRGTRMAMKALKMMPDAWVDSMIKRF